MTSVPKAEELFEGVEEGGELSAESVKLLSQRSAYVDTTFRAGTVEGVSEQTLLTVLLDNTPSMDYAGKPGAATNASCVVDGFNLLVSSLIDARSVGSIELLPVLINPDGRWIKQVTGQTDVFTWRSIREVSRLLLPGYVHGSSTPLYERGLQALAAAVARTHWWEDQGVQTSTITLLMSDGQNNAGTATAAQVAQVVRDMRAAEKHRIFYWGVQGSERVDFREIGLGMGIPDTCISVIPSDPKQIRAMFQLFSQSVRDNFGSA